VFTASRVRIGYGVMIGVLGASLAGCHKDAPQKATPVVVKKSPAEIKQLADSANQSLEGLKPLLGALNAKFKSLHEQFDSLPTDLPEFGMTRGKFYSADEGLGRMNAKIPWLSDQIDAAVKAGDGAALEEISESIKRTYGEIPEVDQLAMELLHEVMPFTRLAEHYEANKKAMCDSDKIGPEAVSKRLLAH